MSFWKHNTWASLERKDMNILVIGNGFDLAHGLPTTYKDFLDYVHAFKHYYETENKGLFEFADK